MRTTLDIEADVLQAAKEIARREKKTAGQILSDLARKALTGWPADARHRTKAFVGFRPFQSRGGVVTNEIIDKLRDEDDS